MSTFSAFQTGLGAGSAMRREREVTEARTKAGEMFNSGNYEGAESLLMTSGLADDAFAFGQAGKRRQTEERVKRYGDAFKTGGHEAVKKVAGGEGDFQTVQSMDASINANTQRNRQTKQFEQQDYLASVKFLGDQAQALKNVAPELRAEEALRVINASPFATPEVVQAVKQAGADGRITDDELDRFTLMLTDGIQQMERQAAEAATAKADARYADETAYSRGQDAIDNARADAKFEHQKTVDNATLDLATQRMEASQAEAARKAAETKDKPPKPLIGSEAMARVAAGLPNMRQAVDGIKDLMTEGDPSGLTAAFAPEGGYRPGHDWGARAVNAIPDWGLLKPVAKAMGGKDYQRFENAYANFEAAAMPIMSGAAVTPAEAERLLNSVRIRMGDDSDTVARKLQSMDNMVKGLEAAANGDIEAFQALLKGDGAPAQPEFPNAPAIGLVEDGYRYIGGDPAKKASWERAG